MFADTLLESSPKARKGKRWPMATAFTLEIIIAAVLVVVPLLSSGVIPIPAHAAIFAPPLKEVPLERVRPEHTSSSPQHGPASAGPRATEVVLVSNNPDAIHFGNRVPTTNDPNEVKPGSPNVGNDHLPSDLIGNGNGPVVKPGPGPSRIISVFSEAQLINRVEPVYPRAAVLANVQGQVKLHAIIARNGKVTSLSVISGHPLLVQSALEAVSQWRYRPYYLNGEAVEVETLVTVNFKREQR